jgi:RNA polymerase sigma factor (sigma-70 family)
MVLAVCRRLLGDVVDADDAFQATFVVLARKAGARGWQESVGSWLYEVAYRCASKIRTASVRRRCESQVPDMPQNETTSDVERRELRAALDDELSHLPEKYRAPLVLCYLEGKSNEEAARLLGCPVGTIYGRLARARDLLRDRLGRRCLLTPVGILLAEDAAPAAVPSALLDATVHAATLSVAGTATMASVPTTVTDLAEGVLKTMWYCKLRRIAAALLLSFATLGLAGGFYAYHAMGTGHAADSGAADQADMTATKKDDSKSDPADCPLRLRLVAKKRDYVLRLDQLRQSLAEYGEEIENPRWAPFPPSEVPDTPPALAVDLVLEFRNTGAEDLVFQLGGNSSGFIAIPRLDGPGAVNLVLRCGPIEAEPPIVPPIEIKLAAGAIHQMPVRELRCTPRVKWPWSIHYAYWTRGGAYRLHFTMDTLVSPAPAGSKNADNGFGRVKLTSNTVSLAVTTHEDRKGKIDPPGVPLEARLVAKKNTCTLNLADKTPAEFRKLLKDFDDDPKKSRDKSVPKTPQVNIELELRNTSDQEIRFLNAHDLHGYHRGQRLLLELNGPGAVTIRAWPIPQAAPFWLEQVALAPGKTFTRQISDLYLHTTTYGEAPGKMDRAAYWTEPGEYTLTATLDTQVALTPEEASQPAAKWSKVTITTAPLKLKVEAPK